MMLGFLTHHSNTHPKWEDNTRVTGDCGTEQQRRMLRKKKTPHKQQNPENPSKSMFSAESSLSNPEVSAGISVPTMQWTGRVGPAPCSPCGGGNLQPHHHSSHHSMAAASACLTRAQPAVAAQITQSSRLTLHPSSFALARLFSADH